MDSWGSPVVGTGPVCHLRPFGRCLALGSTRSGCSWAAEVVVVVADSWAAEVVVAADSLVAVVGADSWVVVAGSLVAVEEDSSVAAVAGSSVAVEIGAVLAEVERRPEKFQSNYVSALLTMKNENSRLQYPTLVTLRKKKKKKPRLYYSEKKSVLTQPRSHN